MKKPLLVLALLLTGIPSVLAQPVAAPAARKFAEIQMQGDFEELVRERLKLAEELEPLKDLLAKFNGDPARFGLNWQSLQDLKNPEKLESLLNKLGGQAGLKGLEKQLKHLQKLAKKFEALENRPPAVPGAPVSPPNASPRTAPTPMPPREDRLAGLKEEILDRVENAVPDHLRNSPAIQRFVEDMKTSLTRAAPESRWGAERWAERLVPKNLPWELGDKMIQRFENLQLPENWNLALPTLPRLKAPQLPTGGGLPSLPAFSAGGWYFWLLLALLCALLGWRAWTWPQRRRGATESEVELGPWPVPPEAIATRAELIQAFDYFALRTLGMAAKSKNHRAVAESWAGHSGAVVEASHTLADLYEAARYTDGPADMTPEQRRQAQHALAVLIEGLTA
jgi:hypothetical protein